MCLCFCVYVQEKEGKDKNGETERCVEALLSTRVNIIRGGNGGRKVGSEGKTFFPAEVFTQRLEQKHKQVPVMTKSGDERKRCLVENV